MGWYVRITCFYWRLLVIFLTPVLLLPLPLIGATDSARCGYVILVMVIYWVTEATSQGATSFVPIFAFPLLGVLSTDDTCLAYLKEPNMLLLAGISAVIGIKDCGINKRVAIKWLLVVGSNPRRLLATIMLTAMLMGTWTNIALITGMMVTIVDEILKHLEMDTNRANCEEISLPNTAVTVKEREREFLYGEVNPAFEFKGETEHGTPELVKNANVYQIERSSPEEFKESCDMGKFRKCLFLSIPYSALIARTGVIMGSPPNVMLANLLKRSFSSPTDLTFLSWMGFCIPTMLICEFLGWIWLQLYFIGLWSPSVSPAVTSERDAATKRFFQSKYNELEPISFHEKAVVVAFIFLYGLWIFRFPWNFPGWIDPIQDAFGGKAKIENSTHFTLIIFLLMIIPKNFPDHSDTSKPACCQGATDPCLPWKSINDKVAWTNIMAIGASLAIGDACNRSNLTPWVGEQLKYLHGAPISIIAILASFLAIVVTNVPTNPVATNMVLPYIMKMSLELCINPLYAMVPVTFCCSLGFMMPMGHPANAIVYTAAKLKHTDMIKAGLGMSIICVVVVNAMINTLGTVVFSLHQDLPNWVNSTTLQYSSSC